MHITIHTQLFFFLTACTDIPEEYITTATISNSMYLTLNCCHLKPQNKLLASSNNKITISLDMMLWMQFNKSHKQVYR
jgi:hypothetical protein